MHAFSTNTNSTMMIRKLRNYFDMLNVMITFIMKHVKYTIIKLQ